MPKPSRYALLAIPLGGVLFLALSLARLDLEARWQDLRAQVLAATGLELTSTGRPELTLFPRPGVSLAEVGLGEAAGAGGPWLRCDRVGARPRLAPLLLGRLELDLIRLDGLRLDLTHTGPGRRPPRAATSDSPDAALAPTPAGRAAPLLRGARIQLVEGAVTWGTAGLSEIDLEAGPVAIEGPTPLRLTGRLDPGSRGDGPHRERLGVSATATLSPLHLEPRSLSLTEVLVLLREDPADPAAEPIELTGSLDLSQTQGPDRHLAVRFDLALNRLDLGATPRTRTVTTPAAPALPSGPAPDPAPGQPVPQVQPGVPPDSARRPAMDLDGTLSVQSLRLAGLHLEGVSVQVRGKDGDLSLDHRAAAFYGGGLAGTLRLDLRGQEPQIELTTAALGFQAGPLLIDLTGATALSGRGDLGVKLATRGRTRDGLVRGLGGSLTLSLHHGALRGLDLSALAGIAGAPALGGQAPNLASFTELNASAAVAQGVLHNEDLVATGPWMRLTGGGTLDLVDARLNWRLTPILQAPPQGGGIRELEGIPIPVQLGGTLGEPTWRVDVAAVLRDVARRRLQDRQGGGLMEQIERRTGVKGLDGVLRGLLGR